ncbi:signal peptide peptidase SppA [Campylobacter sp.]|uniref:signal peptide peptidase SppA n=1 Tax=Campylobacter sp. TaxID=205 RepID=UPI0026DC2D74|nr:signal peptide peptidase SppA [Campylobacter sp.]MDO4673547.1 signal peptide peptidase SppA [Campylobacter sp.]
MRILSLFFGILGRTISYINRYFKTFVLLLLLLLFFWLFAPSSNESASFANLERIDLRGEIFDATTVLEKITKAKENSAIKGVLLLIDSPGGAFAPSMELALAVKDLKAQKPVIVYAAGTMTSGSYLAGVGADKIIANPASFIGSIGVIVHGVDLSALAEKIGIKEQTLKAGAYKEAGTFARAWSEEERAFLQDLIDQSYGLFSEFVAAERGLDINEKEKWADARVFLAAEAQNLGLVDALGNYEVAKKELEGLAKVEFPVWKEADRIDKFLEKLDKQGVEFFSQILTRALASVNKTQIF